MQGNSWFGNIQNQQEQQYEYHEQVQQSAGAGPSTSTAALTRLDRKTAEKKRRMQMKLLCSHLISLVPSHQNPHLSYSSAGPSHKATMTQIDLLEEATNYIQQLKERVNHLKNTKQELITTWGLDQPSVYQSKSGTKLPVIELREVGSHCIELILITTYEMMNNNDDIRLSQAVNILEEEGAEVVNVNVSAVEDMVYHTLIAEIRIPRVGVNMSIIGERLHQLISHPADKTN